MTHAPAPALARQNGHTSQAQPKLQRWECHCALTPLLLATYMPGGPVVLKARDRYYWIEGRVRTVCPRCGMTHEIDPHATAESKGDLR